MRVLVVTNMYPSAERPGFGTFVKVQVDSLRALGVEVKVFRVDTSASRLNYVVGVREVARRLSTGGFDLVHVHFGLCGPMAVWQRRYPVVVSYCGSDIMHRGNRVVSRWVARRAAAVIVKSERLKGVLGHPEAYVIPNGVDLSMFRPMEKAYARSQLGMREGPLQVLFVGDYVGKLKGFNLVARGVEMAGERLAERVELVPVYGEAYERIPLYMNAADVLVMASEWEGSPNAVKEAMACNLPIVAVDVGDVRQLLEGEPTCRIVDRTPEAIAAGIASVLSGRRRARTRERLTELSSEATARRVLSVYERVLSQGGRGRRLLLQGVGR